MWDQKKTTKINPKKPFNHIDVKIGSKDFTKGILQGIKSAYVMYANDESAGNRKPDIGLIVVERKLNWEGDYPDKTVGPICLPSRQDSVYNNTHIFPFITVLHPPFAINMHNFN